jgi:uncharacterized protein (TIGR02444 family)
MEFEDHPLWNFTIEAHQRQGVHEACITLQVNHDIDINFLFWCCWAGAVGAPPLDEIHMQRAMDAVGPWQREIVRPVWRARWKLKPSYGSFSKKLTESLRQQFIKAELNAEHIEMLHLAHAVKIRGVAGVSTWEKASHAASNLKLYLSHHFALGSTKESPVGSQNSIPKNIQEPLSIVLCACFPELNKKEVLSLL